MQYTSALVRPILLSAALSKSVPPSEQACPWSNSDVMTVFRSIFAHFQAVRNHAQLCFRVDRLGLIELIQRPFEAGVSRIAGSAKDVQLQALTRCHAKPSRSTGWWMIPTRVLSLRYFRSRFIPQYRTTETSPAFSNRLRKWRKKPGWCLGWWRRCGRNSRSYCRILPSAWARQGDWQPLHGAGEAGDR